MAVVDGAGAVRGLGNLRVIDASILPEVPSVPTNLTTIMVAEHIYRHTLAHRPRDLGAAGAGRLPNSRFSDWRGSLQRRSCARDLGDPAVA